LPTLLSLSLLEKARVSGLASRGKETEVYVMSVGDPLIKERMAICKELWAAGIKAEFMYKVKPKNIKVQFDIVDRDKIPFAIIVGTNEIDGGTVRIKEQHQVEVSQQLVESGEKDSNGSEVQRTEMCGWLLEKLGRKQE
jgi:histidyl-tRNA synthetase